MSNNPQGYVKDREALYQSEGWPGEQAPTVAPISKEDRDLVQIYTDPTTGRTDLKALVETFPDDAKRILEWSQQLVARLNFLTREDYKEWREAFGDAGKDFEAAVNERFAAAWAAEPLKFQTPDGDFNVPNIREAYFAISHALAKQVNWTPRPSGEDYLAERREWPAQRAKA